MLRPSKTACKPVVQDVTAIACFTPKYDATFSSNSFVVWPSVRNLVSKTFLISSISSSPISGTANGIVLFSNCDLDF